MNSEWMGKRRRDGKSSQNHSPVTDHPWRDALKVVDVGYLTSLGVNVDHVKNDVLVAIEEASRQAVKDYQKMGGKPPLLRFQQKLKMTTCSIPEDLTLARHCNCDSCPVYIREVVPSKMGCQLNCQYCAILANTAIQSSTILYENYAEWFRKQLFINRVCDQSQTGKLYYWSAKTEALSPDMVESGIAQQILCAFEDHVIDEKKRLKGNCPDTLLVITKAGIQDLTARGPNGDTVLELIKRIPDNIQVCGSVSYYNSNRQLAEALEPGARCDEDRFEMLRTLQKNNILASGLLLQPIFPSFLPEKRYYEALRDEVGVERMHVDVLASNIRALSVVIQIVGWYYPEAEKVMWQLYLPQDAPEKSNRRGISPGKHRDLIGDIIRSAREAGIGVVHYCRFTQRVTGLPPRPDEECMAYVPPHPSHMMSLRQRQVFSSGKD